MVGAVVGAAVELDRSVDPVHDSTTVGYRSREPIDIDQVGVQQTCAGKSAECAVRDPQATTAELVAERCQELI
jgi:hypothetical protein